jgi:hypothetical protein
MLTSVDQHAQPLDYLFQDPSFREEDETRLKAWCNGEWYFVGIRAKASIKFPYGTNPECWITAELLSPGLWGIESDSRVTGRFVQNRTLARCSLVDCLSDGS